MSQQIITFKNNLPNLTVLRINSQDYALLQSKIQQTIKQAPMMFIGMQVIIDISAFDQESELVLDVEALIDFLQKEGINPVAVMSDCAAFREVLNKIRIGVLPVLRNMTERTSVDKGNKQDVLDVSGSESKIPTQEPRKNVEVREEPEPAFLNKIIKHPIRSGQRVYAKGDLTVIGFVSSGAEIIADGNIHVYGKLSGRAIAGASGNSEAQIFCKKLDAELVSIAGNYKQLEEIGKDYLNQAVQISLENEKILFSSL